VSCRGDALSDPVHPRRRFKTSRRAVGASRWARTQTGDCVEVRHGVAGFRSLNPPSIGRVEFSSRLDAAECVADSGGKTIHEGMARNSTSSRVRQPRSTSFEQKHRGQFLRREFDACNLR